MKNWILPATVIVFAPALGPGLSSAQEVPAGTVFEVRLKDRVSSFHAKRGDALHAVLIAPVRQDDRELLAAGVEVNGQVVEVKCVGLGLIRERARLHLKFDSLVFPGGTSVPLESRVIEIENAREKVLDDGTIVGIRATDSYGHQATGMVSSAAAVDPMLMLFAFASSSSILRFPEAEITYPAGAEVRLKLLKSLPLADVPASPLPNAQETDAESTSLGLFVSELPYRTHTKTKSNPSDLTNLVFFGSRSQLLQTFLAAGWALADERDPATGYQTVRALAESRGYAEAPVSTLFLDGKPAALVFEKTLNTINKRHHLRVWQIQESWNGQTVWTAAATHDISIGFSSHKTLIHRIDADIDQERAKVSSDLLFAGCANSVEMVERPHVPHITLNASGDRMVTDGRVAVLRLRDCGGLLENSFSPHPDRDHTGNLLYRGVRQFDLTLRNILLRDNVAWQGYRGGRIVWKVAHRHPGSPGGTNSLLSADTGAETEHRLGVATGFDLPAYAHETPRLPEVDFSVNGGQFFHMRLGDLYLASLNPDTDEVNVFQYPMRIEPGVMLGSSVTLHPSHFLCHEIYFGILQANLVTGGDPNPQVDRLKIRMAGYQLEANLAPRRWRFRPFVSAGASLATYRFKNLSLRKKNGIFKLGSRPVGTIVSAFNSAGLAALDGGTVFQPGPTYGGGMKLRITRLLEFRAEYRETYAKDPGVFNKQSVSLTAQGISTAQDSRARRHGAYLLGLSFTP